MFQLIKWWFLTKQLVIKNNTHGGFNFQTSGLFYIKRADRGCQKRSLKRLTTRSHVLASLGGPSWVFLLCHSWVASGRDKLSTAPIFQGLVHELELLPSGKRLHNYGKSHEITIFNGKTHYFYGHVQ